MDEGDEGDETLIRFAVSRRNANETETRSTPPTITLQISANITGVRRLLPPVASLPALTVSSSSRRLLGDPHMPSVNSKAAPQTHFRLTDSGSVCLHAAARGSSGGAAGLFDLH